MSKVSLSKEAKRIIRGLRLLTVAAILVIIVLCAFWNYLIRKIEFSWGYFLLLMGAYLVLFYVFRILKVLYYNKYINALINRDGNAALYREVIIDGCLYGDTYIEYITALYFTGEYEAVVSIATAKLGEKRYQRFWYLYLNHLARTYFCLGDVQKLRAVCDAFDARLATERAAVVKRLEKMELTATMRDYRDFADGNFEACYAYLEAGEKKAKTDYLKHGNAFSRAMILYAEGRCDEARALFETARDHLSGVHMSTLAQKRIEMIDAGLPFGALTECLPTEWHREERRFKVARIIKRVTYAVLAISFAFAIGTTVYRNIEWTVYERRMENAVEACEGYGEAELLDWMTWSNESGSRTELIALYQTEHKGLAVGSIYVLEDRKVYYFSSMFDQVQYGERRFGRGEASGQVFEGGLCKSPEEIPESAYDYFIIEGDGETFYLYLIAH